MQALLKQSTRTLSKYTFDQAHVETMGHVSSHMVTERVTRRPSHSHMGSSHMFTEWTTWLRAESYMSHVSISVNMVSVRYQNTNIVHVLFTETDRNLFQINFRYVNFFQSDEDAEIKGFQTRVLPPLYLVYLDKFQLHAQSPGPQIPCLIRKAFCFEFKRKEASDWSRTQGLTQRQETFFFIQSKWESELS